MVPSQRMNTVPAACGGLVTVSVPGTKRGGSGEPFGCIGGSARAAAASGNAITASAIEAETATLLSAPACLGCSMYASSR
jgi:hypothetical protein